MEKTMNCPYDKTPFIKEIYESDIEIDKCPQCRGIWLDPGELEEIQKTQEIDYSDRLEKHVNKDAVKYNKERQLKSNTINCPGCEILMEKHEHGHNSMIIVDICPSCHGLWLDEGELEALEIYYEKERINHPDMSRIQLLMAGFAHLSHRS
jgi:uncharacterized protein